MSRVAPVASSSGTPRVPKLLANTGWNVGGQVVPMLIGLALLPLLIRTLGLERYGFLTLVWVLVGYASVFDLGISRVLIRVVALRLSNGGAEGANHIARVGVTLLCFFGVVVGATFAACSGWLVTHVVHLPTELHVEALRAMWLVSASIPFVMLTAGYSAVISAHQQFRGQNIVRAALGVASMGGPLLVALWFNRLDYLVAFVLLTRAIAAALNAWLAASNCGFTFRPVIPDRASTRELLSLGGWVSVSNLVGPLLTYLDRLLLGALVPMRMVAFYATPFDLVSRVTLFPYAMMSAVFPTAAAVLPGSAQAAELLLKSLRMLYVLVLPMVFCLLALAHPGLRWWLGDEFAQQGAAVMQLLALGLFTNTLAQAPATLIQAAGQPRTMALLHLVELPAFLALLYALTVRWGIVGTAAAALIRSSVDALALMVLVVRDLPPRSLQWRAAWRPLGAALLVLAAGLWPRTGTEAVLAGLVVLPALAVYAWLSLLQPWERQRLFGILRAQA